MSQDTPVNARVNPVHLLVVDDDEVDRERVQRFMRHSPVKVITHEAASGEEALRLVRSQPFDCVVLDNQLGDTTGSDLLQRLRQEACQDCPVIMVTGAGNEALVVQALQDGAADYLSKIHLSAENLVRAVMRSLEHHQLRRELDDMHSQLERRVEEQAAIIRQRERDLQDILDHASSLIGYWDDAQRVRFGNRAHQAWFGINADQLPGMRVREAMGEHMYALHEPHIKQALDGIPQLFEHTLPGTNGIKTRHVQAEYRPDVDASGQVLGFYVTITDITLIKAAQADVEELLHFVEAVIGNSPVGMAVYRADGLCVLSNHEMATVTGLSEAQLRAQALSALSASQPVDLIEAAQATLHDGRTRHIEVALPRATGQEAQIAWSLARIERGEAPHLLAIARDITEQKTLHESLVNARNAAQEAARVTSAFLANMSHEIRTPMNAIVGLSRLALEEALSPSAQGYLERVHHSALALMGILDDVLDYAKVEAGQMRLEHTEVVVEDMLQRVVDLFSGRMTQKRLHFTVDLAPEVPARIMGDPLRLSQILNNLVGNAVKFTDLGGVHITVTRLIEQGVDTLRFAVRDSGIGIDTQHQHALFAAFAQGDAAITRRFGGTGLGLAICKRLVDMMGGHIGVDSQLGQGSTFWFTVPLSVAPGPVAQNANSTRYRILLVGPDTHSLQQLARQLAPRCSKVVVAADADAACARLAQAAQAQQPIDAVLIDWPQLDANAEALMRRTREQCQQYGAPDTPHIALVPGFEPHRALQVEPDLRLFKPALPSALLQALHRACTHKQAGAPQQASPAHLLQQRGQPLHGSRILLVEDNVLNQMVAQAFLQQAGLEVDTLSNGEEAVRLMERVPAGHFVAILMDMHMPVMDGLEASRRIRLMAQAQGTPIIAMTAAVLPADRERCQEAGMVDMVTKPIVPETLVDTLLKWARPAPPQSAP